MPNAIEGLQPALVWKYFAEIAAIPRCSKHEEAIAAHVAATGRRLGLAVAQDACGNVIVRKPASPGFEHAPSICLQGHLDMVCEKNAGTRHDFSKDPIRLVRKGDVIMADGTTLGADNGIAVATNLAIMEDRSIQHGPLEFLFTIDEETGLTGAANLSPELITSRTLLNLDSEEEGALYVGCSGGRDTLATWKLAVEMQPAGTAAALVAVKGLRGGHSGLEIDKGRGNAIKIAARVLAALAPHGVRLAEIRGGSKRNAIPRECTALTAVPRKSWDAAAAAVARMNAACRAELAGIDPDLAVTIAWEPAGRKLKVLKKPLQVKIVKALTALPHGVLRMSADIPGLVQTSTNVAVIDTTKVAVVLATSQRSSVASELDEAVQTVQAVIELGGGKAESSAGYPGWKPDLSSRILKTAKETYRKLYGKDPAVKAIHAGLECGIIGERVPGIDMVSFGPTLEGVHSPDEKIHIDSVVKFWNFLLAILRQAA